LELVQREFGGMQPNGKWKTTPRRQPKRPSTWKRKRDLEQVHVCIGVPSYPLAHQAALA